MWHYLKNSGLGLKKQNQLEDCSKLHNYLVDVSKTRTLVPFVSQASTLSSTSFRISWTVSLYRPMKLSVHEHEPWKPAGTARSLTYPYMLGELNMPLFSTPLHPRWIKPATLHRAVQCFNGITAYSMHKIASK